MPRHELRFRQIHLDFHTSPHIPDVAADFDPERFADLLQRARVNSVTCFARCHQGMIYYDSKLNPERVHPNLKNRNLLLEQIEACHRRDIRVPIYTTVQWDDYTFHHHREWCCVDEEGRLYNTRPLEPGFYNFLDVFHPGYRQFLFDHTKEILDTLPVDGLFFDIVQPRASLAEHWLAAMDDAGVDPADEEARLQFAIRVINEWKTQMTDFIRRHPNGRDCTIFYNAGHIGPRHRATVDAYTHYELESLPSGGWGYTHFPLTMRYVRGLAPAPGKRPHDCMGMTGKFHTSWGDFHSYKTEEALQFECFQMLAMGAKCSIGDQLHPSGVLDDATYDLIGSVYAEVEKKEPWCRDVTPVNDIGVFTPEEFGGRKGNIHATAERQPAAAIGAVRMLQELHLQFDFISTDRDLSRYKLLILPDRIPVDAALARKLRGYIAAGGAVIATHQSGLADDRAAFALAELGVEYVGEAPFSPDFLVPGKPLRADLRDTAYAMYLRGTRVRAAKGAQTLARVQAPYFDRTWRRFCSHRHTPSAGKAAYPGVVRNGNCIYFMHPLFTQYYENAPRWCRTLLRNAIDLLLPPAERVVGTDGPSTLLVCVNDQPRHKRRIVHLLHYIPERRGQQFDVIQDIVPLHDVAIDLAVDKPRHVKLVPGGETLDFTAADGRVRFTVPRLHGHAMIEVAHG